MNARLSGLWSLTLLCAGSALAGAQVNAVDPVLQPSDAQTPWRYLGHALPMSAWGPNCIHDGATLNCPLAPGWTATDLFGGATIPPGLAPYCAYESSTPNPIVFQDLVINGCLSDFDPDSMAVTPLADPQEFEQLVWPPLHDNFLSQAGVLPEAAAPTQPLVRLTIVDTQPTQQLAAPGNALHGFTLEQMAQDLICTQSGSQRCGVDIRTRLALSYVDFCRGCTSPNGGYFGTISDLARAVRLEVADWEVANVTQPKRLVLNLSVGWDPIFGRVTPTGPNTVPVHALYAAIQDAVCRGAVVVAAAGNRISGPSATPGPLLPGGWEDLGAPNFETCRGAVEPGLVDPADFPSGPTYRPLVYGAGAVSFDDTRVEARTNGEPPRVAYGDHAVGEALFSGEPGPTETQTGTSVGALVVSSAVAAAWHYENVVPAYKVMLENYKSGKALSRRPGYCYPPGGATCQMLVRRISVCNAVAAACALHPGGLCPAPGTFSCAPPPAQPPALPFDDIDALYADASVPHVAISQLTHATSAPGCGANYMVYSDPGDIVDDPCPQLQYYGIQATPWTDGQPSSQPCPTCTSRFQSPGNLYIEIADEFLGDLTDVMVLCGSSAAFRLPDSTLPLAPGDRYLVTGIPVACQSALQIAYRVFEQPFATGDVSALTRVLVYGSGGQ